MGEKSKVLIIGGTGFLGKYLAEASIKAGHPTFVLVRQQSNLSHDPAKSQLIESFKNQGIILIQGDIYDHNSLVKAIKQVDVVIVSVKGKLISDQVTIIAAIKEAGNIKRFLPSEFGNDVDQVQGAVEPAASLFETKVKIRRAIEAQGIPYTYVSCGAFASIFLSGLCQENATSPPKDNVVILGDGNTQGIFNEEMDIATYTIRSVDDPRALNKTLHIRPKPNFKSMNELVSLWENKINKTLNKTYISEDQVLQQIQGLEFPKNLILSLKHAILVKGLMANVEINPSTSVEATELYPEVMYTTVDEYGIPQSVYMRSTLITCSFNNMNKVENVMYRWSS